LTNFGVPWDHQNTIAYYERKANMQKTLSQSDSRGTNSTQWNSRNENNTSSGQRFNKLLENTIQVEAPFDNLMVNALQLLLDEIRMTNEPNTNAGSKEYTRRDSMERSVKGSDNFQNSRENYYSSIQRQRPKRSRSRSRSRDRFNYMARIDLLYHRMISTGRLEFSVRFLF